MRPTMRGTTVRNEIKEFAGTRRLFSSGIKLIVLDEADMMDERRRGF